MSNLKKYKDCGLDDITFVLNNLAYNIDHIETKSYTCNAPILVKGKTGLHLKIVDGTGCELIDSKPTEIIKRSKLIEK